MRMMHSQIFYQVVYSLAYSSDYLTFLLFTIVKIDGNDSFRCNNVPRKPFHGRSAHAHHLEELAENRRQCWPCVEDTVSHYYYYYYSVFNAPYVCQSMTKSQARETRELRIRRGKLRIRRRGYDMMMPLSVIVAEWRCVCLSVWSDVCVSVCVGSEGIWHAGGGVCCYKDRQEQRTIPQPSQNRSAAAGADEQIRCWLKVLHRWVNHYHWSCWAFLGSSICFILSCENVTQGLPSIHARW